MVSIDFGDFAGIDMRDPDALGADIFSAFPTFNFLTGAATDEVLEIPNHPDPAAATAVVRGYGSWSFAVGGDPEDSSIINAIEVDVPGATQGSLVYRVDIDGINVFWPALENALLDRNLSTLYAGQALQILGSATFGDTLVGGSLADEIYGFAGDDALFGNAGDDYLDGMGGADSMTGGAGNDEYTINNAADVINELSGEGVDLAISSIAYTLPPQIEDLSLLDIGGAIDGRGNAGGNYISGNIAVNVLRGLAGNDTLLGLAGNDTLDGGSAGDSMVGGIGNDVLVWQGADTLDGGTGTDTLRLRGNLDLSLVSNAAIANVERIDMTGGGSSTLRLLTGDVLSISSTTNTLKVFGDGGDTVDLPDAFSDRGVTGGFHKYRNGAAIVLVENDIFVT